MKRVLSFILAFCLLTSLFAYSAAAEGNDWQDKLDDALRYKISEASDDDIISVKIDLIDIDSAEADRRLLDVVGYTRAELKEFAMYMQSSIEHREDIDKGYKILAKMYEEHISAVLSGLGITDIRYMSDGRYLFNYSREYAYAVVCVQCGQIPEIARSADVLGIFDMPLIEAPEGKEFLYADVFLGQYCNMYGLSTDWLQYDELYYHRDDNGEIDWALIFAEPFISAPWIFYTVTANRVLIKDGWESPFTTGYAVYDVKNDKFVDTNYGKYYNGQRFDPGEYPGFIRAFDEYGVKMNNSFYVNRLIGDVDLDDELSIIDATLIQRCDVHMRDWPQDDLIDPKDRYTEFDPLTYYSDFNRDGERDIIDATMLQRYVTGID